MPHSQHAHGDKKTHSLIRHSFFTIKYLLEHGEFSSSEVLADTIVQVGWKGTEDFLNDVDKALKSNFPNMILYRSINRLQKNFEKALSAQGVDIENITRPEPSKVDALLTGAITENSEVARMAVHALQHLSDSV
jgi:hypothetical protein